MSIKSIFLLATLLNFLFAALNLLMFFLTGSAGSAGVFLVNLVVGGLCLSMWRNTAPEEKSQ